MSYVWDECNGSHRTESWRIRAWRWQSSLQSWKYGERACRLVCSEDRVDSGVVEVACDAQPLFEDVAGTIGSMRGAGIPVGVSFAHNSVFVIHAYRTATNGLGCCGSASISDIRIGEQLKRAHTRRSVAGGARKQLNKATRTFLVKA